MGCTWMITSDNNFNTHLCSENRTESPLRQNSLIMNAQGHPISAVPLYCKDITVRHFLYSSIQLFEVLGNPCWIKWKWKLFCTSKSSTWISSSTDFEYLCLKNSFSEHALKNATNARRLLLRVTFKVFIHFSLCVDLLFMLQMWWRLNWNPQHLFETMCNWSETQSHFPIVLI